MIPRKTPHSIPDFPKELYSLKQTYSQHLSTWTPSTAADFYPELLAAINELKEGKYLGVQPGLCVAFCGVEQFSWVLESTHIPASFFNDINNILTIVAEYEVLDILSADYGHENTLASLLLTRIHMAQQRNVYYDLDSVHFLLKQLTGKEPPTNAVRSLQKAIAFLYGNAAWDLYNLGEVPSVEVSHMTYKQQIPIISKHAPYQSKSTVQMPPDMT